MSYRIEAADVRAEISVAEYAETYLGVELRPSGEELRGTCPLCGSDKRRPFCARGDVWICHACDARGDVITLCQIAENWDFQRTLAELASIAGLDSTAPQGDEDERRRRRQAREAAQAAKRQRAAEERKAAEKRAGELWPTLDAVNIDGLEYLRSRRVERAIGDIAFNQGAVCLPLRQGNGNITNIVQRRFDGNEPKVEGLPKCGTRGTFGDLRKVDETEGAIVIVEGVFDWLSARVLAPKRLVLGAHGAARLPDVVQIAGKAAGSHLEERGVVFVPHRDGSGIGQRKVLKAIEVAQALGVPKTKIYVFDVGEGADDLNDFLQGTGDGDDPFAHLRNLEEDEKQRCFDLTDAGNAARFAHYHQSRLRYWGEWDQWLCWDGRRWKSVRPKEEVAAAAIEVTEHIEREAIVTRRKDPDMAEVLKEWAAKSRSIQRISAMYDLARSLPKLRISTEQLDRETYLLTVENGTLDLRSGELRPHRQEDLLTQLAPVVYDPDAKCPRWDRFVAEVFEPNPDAAVFVQRYGGYSLTGDTSAQCLLFAHGYGSNGKGVIFRMLQSLLGRSLAYQAAYDTFLQRSRGENPKVELAAMQGARMVLATETNQKGRLNEGLIKSITGGDMVTGEAKYKPPMTYQPRYKLWLSSNPEPDIKSTDEGFWRRFRLVPFLVTFEGDRRDDHLEEYLHANERAGIFRWFVEGALAWRHDGGGLKGLGYSESISAATAELRQDNDDLGKFFEDRCVINPSLQADTRALYRAYTSWCQEQNRRAINDVHFGRAMKSRGFNKVRGHRSRYYGGIGLLASHHDEEEWEGT